jgi:hypothetical protein
MFLRTYRLKSGQLRYVAVQSYRDDFGEPRHRHVKRFDSLDQAQNFIKTNSIDPPTAQQKREFWHRKAARKYPGFTEMLEAATAQLYSKSTTDPFRPAESNEHNKSAPTTTDTTDPFERVMRRIQERMLRFGPMRL